MAKLTNTSIYGDLLVTGTTNLSGSMVDVEVVNSAVAEVPLTIDGITGTTAWLQKWSIAGSLKSYMHSSGRFYTTGVYNLNSGSNSSIDLLDNGLKISRNIADANPALIVNQVHSSSTGNIMEWQFGGTTKARIEINGNLRAGGLWDLSDPAYFLNPADTGTSLNVAGSVRTPLIASINSSNGFISLPATGIEISRDIADTNPALIVDLSNAGATGSIQDWNYDGVRKAYMSRFGTMFANSFFDVNNSSYFLNLSSTGTSLDVAGLIKAPSIASPDIFVWPDNTGARITGYDTTGIEVRTVNDSDIYLNAGSGNVVASTAPTLGDHLTNKTYVDGVSGNTDLDVTVGTSTVTVTSSTGTDAVIPAANNNDAGIVTNGVQSFLGLKTFPNLTSFSAGIAVTGDITIGGAKVVKTTNSSDTDQNRDTVVFKLDNLDLYITTS